MSEVTLREYIETILGEREKQTERVFAERETSAEFKRLALKDALDNAKITTDAAMEEAKRNVKTELDKAKIAADERGLVLQTRIEKLESGGAPFASRLDDGMTKLAEDVRLLNLSAVKQEVVQALRYKQDEDAKMQRRQARAAFATATVALVIAVIQIAASLANG